MELDGAVAVVTGAAYGIGRATAIALSAAGCDVVVVDIADDQAQSTVAAIEESGGAAQFVHADVASRADMEAMASAAIEWRGHCDLLIANAAISGTGAPHEFSADDWEHMLGVNLFGAIWAMRPLLPHMIERDHGHLCFVSSGAGFIGIAHNAPYATTKFALVGLAESLAIYLKESGVSVSLVAPGAVGGAHADTMRVAGAEHMSSDEVEAIKARQRDKMATWPAPEGMAALIVDGIRRGRYYIIQEGPGHEGWLSRTFRERAEDPEAYLRRLT